MGGGVLGMAWLSGRYQRCTPLIFGHESDYLGTSRRSVCLETTVSDYSEWYHWCLLSLTTRRRESIGLSIIQSRCSARSVKSQSCRALAHSKSNGGDSGSLMHM